jgi:hypothetical protein
MSGAGPSSLWCHGFVGDARGPNAVFVSADDTANCGQLTTALGGSAELIRKKMTCYSNTAHPLNRQAASRSLHAGGVFTCLCDGSVQFISDNIQTGTSMTDPSTWDRLLLSSDGQPIPSGAF